MRWRLLCFLTMMGYVLPAAGMVFTPAYLAQVERQYGDYAKRRLVAWQQLSENNHSEIEVVKKVNLFFNLLSYQQDLHHWGIKEYWATPLEVVLSGAGDCEDFALAKYFSLRDVGLDDEKLLLVVNQEVVNQEGVNSDQHKNNHHMILAYYPDPKALPWLLDNINKQLLPADQRTDLVPIYGINASGLWQMQHWTRGQKIHPAQAIKKWQDLEQRMLAGTIRPWHKQGREGE